MANVVASTVGGSPQRLSAETVGDAREQLGLAATYTAAVNGEPADDSTYLDDEAFVSFAPAVKGGGR